MLDSNIKWLIIQNSLDVFWTKKIHVAQKSSTKCIKSDLAGFLYIAQEE